VLDVGLGDEHGDAHLVDLPDEDHLGLAAAGVLDAGVAPVSELLEDAVDVLDGGVLVVDAPGAAECPDRRPEVLPNGHVLEDPDHLEGSDEFLVVRRRRPSCRRRRHRRPRWSSCRRHRQRTVPNTPPSWP
jgi:hypothetical protein